MSGSVSFRGRLVGINCSSISFSVWDDVGGRHFPVVLLAGGPLLVDRAVDLLGQNVRVEVFSGKVKCIEAR